ncbi:MerR family transcriptional regulator [Bacillus sp. REN3]|uniref:MerR family transcriptional regulator n=1 Tax=Bacillus sp. REN3 TaxID=2802440 RepID=UPI001AEDA45A|nr:MerR family transcriptional regulator [Bacillus sp. REN3]
MTETQYMKAYTIKEVSKRMNVPSGTLRQWEKDLEGLLFIPRTKQGARFYTDIEIEMLMKIKQMRDKNLSKEVIRDLLQRHNESHAGSEPFEATRELSIEPSGPATSYTHNEIGYQAIMSAMEQYKESLIEEVKIEIRNGIRKEVLEEVKKEISKGTYTTVRAISDSVYKSSEKTAEQITELSNSIVKSSEQNSEVLGVISAKISNVSKGTSDRINSLTNSLAKSSKGTMEKIIRLTNSVEKLSLGTNKDISKLVKRLNQTTETISEEFQIFANYQEARNEEFSNLSEAMNQERNHMWRTMKNEREEFRQLIIKRDEMFKGMVESFRETAAAKSSRRNWWKVWK